jgi:hypothetical protein
MARSRGGRKSLSQFWTASDWQQLISPEHPELDSTKQHQQQSGADKPAPDAETAGYPKCKLMTAPPGAAPRALPRLKAPMFADDAILGASAAVVITHLKRRHQGEGGNTPGKY